MPSIALHVAFGVDVAHHFGELAHARDQAHHLLQQAELQHLRIELLAEVVERELALGEPLFLAAFRPGRIRGCAFSTSVRMSPWPRMRPAMRSGWNSSSASRCSPVPMNLIGTPVTCLTESAAPPRASPSSLVMMTPSSSSASLNALALLTASWPGHAVDDQVHLVRAALAVDPLELVHQLFVDRAGGRPCRE